MEEKRERRVVNKSAVPSGNSSLMSCYLELDTLDSVIVCVSRKIKDAKIEVRRYKVCGRASSYFQPKCLENFSLILAVKGRVFSFFKIIMFIGETHSVQKRMITF